MSGWVTTFYSYKGGVGRTFLLANVGWLLARWGRRVLCLDWDLEAPGLHRYLAPLAPRRHGMIDVIEGIDRGDASEWRHWVETVSGPWTGKGRLDLLAAGPGGDDYIRRVQALDWDRLSDRGFEGGLEAIREEWVRDYDHVLIDSRTGITDIGGICAAQLPDLLVLTFTATFQSLEGAIDVADRAMRARSQMPLSRGAFNVLPVPCRVHAGEEDRLEQEWSKRFESELADLFEPWKDRDVEVREYIAQLRVREQARWSFGEQMPVRTEPLDDPLRVSHAFANVAALIDLRLDTSDAVVRDRHALLARLAGSEGLAAPTPESRFDVDVYMAFEYSEEIYKTTIRLRAALRSRGLRCYDSLGDLSDPVPADEVRYQTREAARAIIVFFGRGPSGDILAPDPHELDHIERLAAESRAMVVPVFRDNGLVLYAPAFMRRLFGVFLDAEPDAIDKLARTLAHSLTQEAPASTV